VAAENGAAITVDAVFEVLTAQEDHSSFPTLQVLVIDKAPVLHTKQRSIDLYESTGT